MGSTLNNLLDRFEKSGIIKNEDREIYYFGLKQTWIFLLNFMTIIVVSLIFGIFWSLIVFSVAYLMLRQYAGGYHAETELGCYISSTIMSIIAAYILKEYSLGLNIVIPILLVSSISTLILSPVEDHHKPLDELEIRVYSKRMRRILFGELILIAFSSLFEFNLIVEAASLGIAAIGIIVILGWLKNKIYAIRQ